MNSEGPVGILNTTVPRRTAGLAFACGVLTLVLLAAYPLFAWHASVRHGAAGLWAAAIAGLVCWLGASTALVLAAVFRGPDGTLNGLLLGMLFRMGIPLGAGLLLSSRGGPLAEAGVFGYVVLYYLLALVVETLLSLRLMGTVGSATCGNAASGDAAKGKAANGNAAKVSGHSG